SSSSLAVSARHGGGSGGSYSMKAATLGGIVASTTGSSKSGSAGTPVACAAAPGGECGAPDPSPLSGQHTLGCSAWAAGKALISSAGDCFNVTESLGPESSG